MKAVEGTGGVIKNEASRLGWWAVTMAESVTTKNQKETAVDNEPKRKREEEHVDNKRREKRHVDASQHSTLTKRLNR